MESPFDNDQDMEDIIEDLENASRIPTKQRVIKISNHIDKISSRAYEHGLSDASLERLVDIITLPNELDQASISNLIKNLYPSTKVPDTVVIKVVGSLGHGQSKPSYAAQAALLKWLIMVYDVLENRKILSQLYAVIFNLLDTIALRSQLCHVLSLITRRKHVRPFRIQALMQWTRQAGQDPALVGLMRVYKDYYPEVIVGNVTAGRASVFTHPNREWRERLAEIQEDYLRGSQDELTSGRGFRVSRKSTKERKHSFLPEVHTLYAHETSTTLEEIEDVNDFVSKLEKIELPNQLVAAINDPLLQKFLQLKSSPAMLQRIDNWLMAFFEDQLENSRSSETEISDMLEAIRGYTRFNKKLPTACLSYLQSMMPLWNGKTNCDLFLELLSYIPIGSFEELYRENFQLLEEAIFDNTPESQLIVLEFYRALLNQWGVSLGSPTSTTHAHVTAIDDLIDHANELALTILQSSSSVAVYSTILDFYETNASLISNPTLISKIRIAIPPSQLIYTLYFSSDVYIVSRLCNVLAIYKRAFEAARAPGNDHQPYPKDYVNQFNGFLMDICNCLWRSRAFNTTDVNALGCLLPESTTTTLSKYISKLDTSLSLNSLFGFSCSPAVCHLAISYVRDLEDQAEDEIDIRHAGPVTQTSLKQLEINGGLRISWQDYRMGVLRYLEERGFVGVGEFMYNTMKHLMAARENRT